MKIHPFVLAIPFLLIGGTKAPNYDLIDAKLLTGNISLTLKQAVWKLWQDKPVYQNITLDLVCERANCQSKVWGYAAKFNKEVDHRGTVKVTQLDIAWRLQVKMNIQSHPWSKEVRTATYNIEVVPYKDQLLGSYTGILDGQKLQNKVNGSVAPFWPIPIASHQPLQPLEHPRLIFRKSEIDQLRQKAKTSIGQTVLAQLNDSLKQKIYYDGYAPNGGYHATGYCFLALINRDNQKAETAWGIVEKSLANPGKRPLEQSAVVAGVALAYDLCYDLWSENRRQQITRWLYGEGKKLLKGGSSRDNWNGTAWSNWNARARGAAGLAALAILKEPLPEDTLYSAPAQVDMAKRQIERYFFSAIGDHGFGTEGDHYTTEPMIISVFPFLQAYKNVIGADFVTGSHANEIIPHYLTRIILKESALPIPPYGKHSRYVGESLFTMALGLIPATHLSAVKWVLKGHRKALFDPYYPQIAPFILAGYREDVSPVNPAEKFDRVLVDEQKGFYVFRNRWQDDNDFVASIYLKRQPLGGSWSFPDVGSFRIWGLGGRWATLENSGGEREGENVVILPKSRPWRQSEPVAFTFRPNGSGMVTLRTDNIILKGVKPPSGIGAIRSFAVDYSGASGSPGLFVLLDKFIGNIDEPEFRGRTWIMNTEGAVTLDKNQFTITNPTNGATMQGTFITPSSVRLSWQKTEAGGRISAMGGDHFFVVMTVQKGTPPNVTVSGSDLEARVKIGQQEISIDRDIIVLNKDR